MANIKETSISRLVQNSESIRVRLNARNMYNINTQYPIKTDSVSNKILNSVNALAQIVTPYSGYDLRNTVFGRAIEDRTPLTEFGLVMLGKHFAMNAAKRAANQVIPIIKPLNLLPWRDGKVITNRKDLSITVDSSVGGFQRFLHRIIHFYPNSANPFSRNPTNLEYLKNTGKAQLDFLYSNINNNLFTSAEIRIFAGDDNVPTRAQKLTPNKFYFTKTGSRAKDFHPYFSVNYKNIMMGWEQEANLAMQESLEYLADKYPDYGADIFYINEILGTSHKEVNYYKTDLQTNHDDDINIWVNKDSGFSRDAEEKIVWGRDGITISTDNELSKLRGINNNLLGDSSDVLDIKFNVRAGLLEYTRNLINSKGGHGSGDITRKVFTDDNKIVGFNGSGLWQAPSTALERFRNRRGVRQHSVLDQYGSFAKAIRFDGNFVYGGNPDSVIYKSVLPKIHPIINEETGKIDARNLMFSIENLAIEVKASSDKHATIDDEFGTQIPISELGPFNGRLMWFPPYNLELTETHAANFESTVMVGRNEPMYNYMHSERAGTIRFSLIIDYPPQLKNYKGIDKHKKIAEFFAFGGEVKRPDILNLDKLKKRENDIQKKIDELENQPKYIEPIMPPAESKISVSFPNDWPLEENSTTIFQEIYNKAYEINRKVPSSQSLEGTQFGINEGIFYPKGIRLDLVSNLWFFVSSEAEQFDQYGYNPRNPDTFETTDNLETLNNLLLTKLDKYLLEVYSSEDNRKLIGIKIDAGASKLYFDRSQEANYNFQLGRRRANATKNFVNARLKALFDGKDANALGIEFNLRGIDGTGSVGSTQADEKNATIDRINFKETKKERFALISFERTNKTIEREPVNLTPEQKQNLEQWKRDLEEVRELINRAKKTYNRDLFREKTAGNEQGLNDAGRIGGFGNIAQNYYAPVFHSQTPEDFHRRLTFLHQCMRQGAAKRYEVEIDNTGTPRARNSVFGRQPICILRIGDFFYTKIIIENLTIDYDEAPWDTNPEGFGMQPMIANITLNIKIMGGQSLKAPIDALQNALAFNWYANSTYTDEDVYKTATYVSIIEELYRLNPNENLRNSEGKLKSYEEIQELVEIRRKAKSTTE